MTAIRKLEYPENNCLSLTGCASHLLYLILLRFHSAQAGAKMELPLNVEHNLNSVKQEA